MKRWLYAYRVVSGSPRRLRALLLSRIGELLCAATRSEHSTVGADGSFTMRLPGELTGLPVAKRVRVTTGVATTSGDRLLIPLAWHADPVRAVFPAFEGTLELEPHSAATAQATLVGAYRPPLGPAGAAIDATVLRRTAERTARQVIDGLARELVHTEGGTEGVSEQARPPGDAGSEGLTVRDVMTLDPLLLDEGLPLRTAALLLFHYEVGGAPVIAADGSLEGVLSEADLIEKEATPRHGFGRAAGEAERRRTATTVGRACSRPALVTAADVPLRAVARVMGDRRVARLVVVDESRIAGIVTRHDVLRALVRSDADIQAAVDMLLEELGEAQLAARIEWGIAHLEGTISRRSLVPGIVGRMEAIDGVINVDDSELTWASDDVVPPSAYLQPM